MIQLHVAYTMKPGIHPKAFFDALNAANIPSLMSARKRKYPLQLLSSG